MRLDGLSAIAESREARKTIRRAAISSPNQGFDSRRERAGEFALSQGLH